MSEHKDQILNGCDECNCMCRGVGIPRTKAVFNANHAEGCSKYDPTAEAVAHIQELIAGIEAWAHDEDGVHPDCYEAYKSAVGFVDYKKFAEICKAES